jgi:DNA polymerase (family X)
MRHELKGTAILRTSRRRSFPLAAALTHLAVSAELRGDLEEARQLAHAAQYAAEHPTARRWRKAQRRSAGTDPVGPLARVHVNAIAEHGARAHVEAIAARLPRDVAALAKRLGLDAVLEIFRRHPFVTVADLRAEAGASDRVARLETHITSIRADQPRVPLGRAISTLEYFALAVGHPIPGPMLMPSGSLRRFEPTIGDITLLVLSDDSEQALSRLLREWPERDLRHRSNAAASVLFDREEINLRAVSAESAGPALIHYTGSDAHVRQLRKRAAERGLVLDAHVLADQNGAPLRSAIEADVYAALGLPYIPPELRHGEDEIRRAEKEPASRLVEVGDIRGDLHVHTLWSDGRDRTETMVWSACQLGYEYVAITDHSPSARASRVLTIDRLRQQMEEVRALRQRYPGLSILQGAEVDILPDGSLDLPDEVLKELDIVLASLHDANGHDPQKLAARYLAAIRHPLVNVITHPTNRIPGRTEGYALDWDHIFEVAAQTGTAIEVDGAPGHLDLDGALARRAVAAGATLVIDSDCHIAERLGLQMRLGVGTARRGFVEARHVLNARPLRDVLAFVTGKRRQ